MRYCTFPIAITANADTRSTQNIDWIREKQVHKRTDRQTERCVGSINIPCCSSLRHLDLASWHAVMVRGLGWQDSDCTQTIANIYYPKLINLQYPYWTELGARAALVNSFEINGSSVTRRALLGSRFKLQKRKLETSLIKQARGRKVVVQNAVTPRTLCDVTLRVLLLAGHLSCMPHHVFIFSFLHPTSYLSVLLRPIYLWGCGFHLSVLIFSFLHPTSYLSVLLKPIYLWGCDFRLSVIVIFTCFYCLFSYSIRSVFLPIISCFKDFRF